MSSQDAVATRAQAHARDPSLPPYDLEPRPGESPLVMRRLRAFADLLDDGIDVDVAAEQVARHPAYGLRSWKNGGAAPVHPSRIAGQLLRRIAPQGLEDARECASAFIGHRSMTAAHTLIGLVEKRVTTKDQAAAARVQLEACRLVLEVIGAVGKAGTTVNVDNRELHVHAGHEDAVAAAQTLIGATA